VAAAVILAETRPIGGLDDSKALTARARDRLYDLIIAHALAVACVIVEAGECDRMGIQAANLYALRQAILTLEVTPTFVLTDGFAVPDLPMPSLGMWKADQVAPCVSAASIVAKVTRDRIMTSLDEHYPDYEFSKHKGYATALHQRHLDRHGPCPQHRMSYGNVAKATKVKSL
jgi:ribonuclease HII